jgi:tetratricopeptide (TPR) repeat protein
VGIIGWSAWPAVNPDALVRQALIAQNPGDQARLLEQAIHAAGGNYPAAEIQLCLAFARMKEWAKVRTHFASLDKEHCPASSLLALAKRCLDVREWETAEDVLLQLPQDVVSTEPGLELFLDLYSGTNRVQPHIQTLEKLTRVAPDNPRYWWSLTKAQEAIKNTSAAIRVLEEALGHKLPAREALEMGHSLLEHRIEVGDVVLSRKQLTAMRAAGETGPQLDFYDACIYQLEGQTTPALNSLEIVLHELGDVPQALRLRGITHFELGHIQQAAADLKRVTELTPDDEIAHFKLAEIYRRLGQTEQTQKYQQLAQQALDRYQEIRKRKLDKQNPQAD